jgi:hypothetical protein
VGDALQCVRHAPSVAPNAARTDSGFALAAARHTEARRRPAPLVRAQAAGLIVALAQGLGAATLTPPSMAHDPSQTSIAGGAITAPTMTPGAGEEKALCYSMVKEIDRGQGPPRCGLHLKTCEAQKSVTHVPKCVYSNHF